MLKSIRILTVCLVALAFGNLHFYDAAANDNGVLIDQAGPLLLLNDRLYGETEGSSKDCKGCGIVFMLRVGGESQEIKHIYRFKGGSDGSRPDGGLAADADGNLYGTTAGGFGTIFRLEQSASGFHKATLHAFTNDLSTGLFPHNGVVLEKSGAIYGTTTYGGDATRCRAGCGTIFKLTPESGRYNFSVIYRLKGGTDGEYPESHLILDKAGNIYGTTTNGGTMPPHETQLSGGECGGAGCGIVFALRPSKSGYTEEVLYRFSGGSDGSNPVGGVISDNNGDLYGATEGGGEAGWGAVFRLTRDKSSFREQVLYSFHEPPGDGSSPASGLIFGRNAELLGTTMDGGSEGKGLGNGTVYALEPNGSGYTERVLYSFKGDEDGYGPVDRLVEDYQGALYGMTGYGGRWGYGRLFRITRVDNRVSEVALFDFGPAPK